MMLVEYAAVTFLVVAVAALHETLCHFLATVKKR